MTYEETLAYIHSINWCFCKPGLERISALCEGLGHPERDLKFIHVAGTNGKGSFCSMTSSILRAAGYKTGLYTSPYIKTFNERMQIDGENISEEELIEITEYVRPIADAMIDRPTEFELITAIAFEYFRRNRCDVVVLEAGLGGRLDSTNIIRHPLLSVITGIALDHTALLGDTVEQIAAEKAGIIKDGAPVLFGGTDEGARKVIADTAHERGSTFTGVDYGKLRNIRATLEGSTFDFGERKDLFLRLLGLYQPRNAAVVLEAVGLLRKSGLDLSEKAIRQGLGRAVWHARFEKVCQEPLILFDGAHNPQGIREAVRSIQHYFEGKKVYLLTGVLRDKDYGGIAEMLATVAERAFTLTPDSPRALSAAEYAAVLQKAGVSAESFENIEKAFFAAKAAAKETGTPLVCLGSLYVYASLCPLFDRESSST